jgi:hypothetical protein
VLTQALSALIGLWAYVSPGVVGLDGRAETSAYVFGALALAVSAVAAFDILRGLRWANVATGLLLAATPAVFGFGGSGLVNALVCGAAIAVLALVTPPADMTRRGGGWSRVVRRG